MYNYEFFSDNQDYNFDLIPDYLNFFERKKIIQKKLDSLDDNFLVYVDGNKLLSVRVENNEKYWLLYEKARFFFSLFEVENRFILINENDEFFYGYIEGFPCLFCSEFERSHHIMQDYSNGEFICYLGVGVVEKQCYQIKTYNEIIQKEFKSFDYLRENALGYDVAKPDFNVIVVNYLSQYYILSIKKFFLQNIVLIGLALLFTG